MQCTVAAEGIRKMFKNLFKKKRAMIVMGSDLSVVYDICGRFDSRYGLEHVDLPFYAVKITLKLTNKEWDEFKKEVRYTIDQPKTTFTPLFSLNS